MIRVAAVDDHPLFLEGVLQSLRLEPSFEVVGSGVTASDAIQLGVSLAPDVLILDLSMPTAGDGFVAIEALAARAPAVRTLILTAASDEAYVVEAIRKGARGYVLKGIGGAELISVVHTLCRGETYISPTLSARPVSRFGKLSWTTALLDATQKPLGAREQEILSLIAKGFSNKAIGAQLGLSDKTVKHYITGLLHKLKVQNRTEAAVIAMQWLMQPGAAPDPQTARAAMHEGHVGTRGRLSALVPATGK